MSFKRAGFLSQASLTLFIGAGALVAGHTPVNAQNDLFSSIFGDQTTNTIGMSVPERIKAYKAKGAAWGAREDTVKTILRRRGLPLGTPIFIRAFKKERELEVWARGNDGRYIKLKTMKTCYHSGTSGPKQRQGDKQVPEGVYEISANWQLNPNSQYTRAFNVAYPNAVDRAHKRTGGLIMVHGSCLSVGCLAMGDVPIKGLYDIVAAARAKGHTTQVQIFPFRMTNWNMPSRGKWASFWRELKPIHDVFERTKTPPKVYACGKHYSMKKGRGCTTINGGRVKAAPVLVAKRHEQPEAIVIPIPKPVLARSVTRLDPAIENQKAICAADIAKFNNNISFTLAAKCAPEFLSWSAEQRKNMFYCPDDKGDGAQVPTLYRSQSGKGRSFRGCHPLDNPEALADLTTRPVKTVLGL